MLSFLAYRLSRVPENLTELAESMTLLEKVKSEEKDMEEKFAPIEEQFAILDKYEVTYETEVSTRRINLFTDWTAFKDTIVNCDEVSTDGGCRSVRLFILCRWSRGVKVTAPRKTEVLSEGET